MESGYTNGMRKATLRIDDNMVEQAANILGTHGLQATIDRALMEGLAMDARRRVVEQLRTTDGLDLNQTDVMVQAWR